MSEGIDREDPDYFDVARLERESSFGGEVNDSNGNRVNKYPCTITAFNIRTGEVEMIATDENGNKLMNEAKTDRIFEVKTFPAPLAYVFEND